MADPKPVQFAALEQPPDTDIPPVRLLLQGYAGPGDHYLGGKVIGSTLHSGTGGYNQAVGTSEGEIGSVLLYQQGSDFAWFTLPHEVSAPYHTAPLSQAPTSDPYHVADAPQAPLSKPFHTAPLSQALPAWPDGPQLNLTPTVTITDGMLAQSYSETGEELEVEIGASASYIPRTAPGSGQELAVLDAFNLPLYTLLPVRRTREGARETVEFESVLSRLLRERPPRILVAAKDINGTDSATMQEALTYMLDTWGIPHAPVPAITIKGLSTAQQPELLYLSILQNKGEERTLDSILREYLDFFSGYSFRADSLNRLEIIAPPWVTGEGTVVTLGYEDQLSQSGNEDATRIINRASRETQGYKLVSDPQNLPEVMEPAYAEVAVFDIPDPSGRVDVTGGNQVWEYQPDILVGGDSIEIDMTAQGYIADYPSGNNPRTQGSSKQHTLTLPALDTVEYTFSQGIIEEDYTLTVRMRWEPERKRIIITETNTNPYPNTFTGRVRTGWLLLLNGYGAKWQQANETFIGEYGFADSQGPGSSESQNLYGVRPDERRTELFQMTNEQLNQAAKAFVLDNLNPYRLYNIQQSAWNKHIVRPEHRGKLASFAAPDGALTGTVVGRSYQEASEPDAYQLESPATIRVVEDLLANILTRFGNARFGSGRFGDPSTSFQQTL